MYNHYTHITGDIIPKKIHYYLLFSFQILLFLFIACIHKVMKFQIIQYIICFQKDKLYNKCEKQLNLK